MLPFTGALFSLRAHFFGLGQSIFVCLACGATLAQLGTALNRLLRSLRVAKRGLFVPLFRAAPRYLGKYWWSASPQGRAPAHNVIECPRARTVRDYYVVPH